MRYWMCVCDVCLEEHRKDYIVYRIEKRKVEYTFNGIEWYKGLYEYLDKWIEEGKVVPLLGRGIK